MELANTTQEQLDDLVNSNGTLKADLAACHNQREMAMRQLTEDLAQAKADNVRLQQRHDAQLDLISLLKSQPAKGE